MKEGLLNLIENIVRETMNTLKEDENSQDKKDSKMYGKMMGLLNNTLYTEAEIMRRLWNPKPDEEDGKRSLFSKKKRGELNDDGVAYSFDESEVQRIIDILSKS